MGIPPRAVDHPSRTGYEEEVLMLIRIIHVNKWLSRHKEIEGTGFTVALARYSEAFYTVKIKKPASYADQSNYC